MRKPHYMGIYDGELADKAIRDYVDQSDAILNIGAKLTDSATAGYSYQFDIDDVVMINHHNFKMNETKDTDVSLVDLLAGLNKLNYVNHMDFPKYQRPSAHDYDLNDDP